MKPISIFGAGLLFTGFFQVPSAPPMRLGLWESTSSMTMQIPGMAGPKRPPIVVKSMSCITADTWARAFTDSGRAGACTRTNERYSAGHLSFDLVCPNVSGTGHGEMRFDSGTARGTVHMNMKPQGQKASSDMAIASKFIGSECGAVQPGKPEVVR